MPPFPPRLHVLLARDSAVGVVLRRGPSRCVASVLWDRRTDEFRLGQWLKGRIYERRCDLSPDGRHLIYFAMDGRWHTESQGSWTAISRAPYLKAIAFFPGGGCGHGGGLWTGPQTYWLNDGYGHTIARDTTAVRRDRDYEPPLTNGGECPGVYYPRLIRDGWAIGETRRDHWHDRTTFEKSLPAGWLLRKVAHAQLYAPPGKGCYWDEHALTHPASGRAVEYPRWEWADVDGDRLEWAAAGKLYRGRVTADRLRDETELFDFAGMTFAPVAAPY